MSFMHFFINFKYIISLAYMTIIWLISTFPLYDKVGLPSLLVDALDGGTSTLYTCL